MQNKKNLFILYILNGLIILFFSLLIFFLISNQIDQTSSYVKITSFPIPTGQLSGNIVVKEVIPWIPVRLRIPAIKVDAFLKRVWLTVKWAVAVPKSGVNAAWYELGPRPGKVGNAVIVGHYGTWKNGQWSVFDNLKKLHIGDMIFVEDDSWNIFSFVVVALKVYPSTAIVPEVFTSKDEKSHLNIITCGGTWNKVTKHYPDRLVVFTEKVVE